MGGQRTRLEIVITHDRASSFGFIVQQKSGRSRFEGEE